MAQLGTSGKFAESVTPTRNAGPNGIASGPGTGSQRLVHRNERGQSRTGHRRRPTVLGVHVAQYRLRSRSASRSVPTETCGSPIPGPNSIWRVEQLRAKPHVQVHTVSARRQCAAVDDHQRTRRRALVHRTGQRQHRPAQRQRHARSPNIRSRTRTPTRWGSLRPTITASGSSNKKA